MELRRALQVKSGGGRVCEKGSVAERETEMGLSGTSQSEVSQVSVWFCVELGSVFRPVILFSLVPQICLLVFHFICFIYFHATPS